MKELWRTSVALFLVPCVGCATITNGTTKDVRINSTPAGANVLVDGLNRGETPTMVTLRRRHNYNVAIEKECYESESRNIRRSFHFFYWLFGNALIGGVVGWIVDIATGAAWGLKPEHLQVELRNL